MATRSRSSRRSPSAARPGEASTPEVSARGVAFPQSPIRKLHELALAAERRGAKIHGLNIGQPDLATPPALIAALHAYRADHIAYSPSRGERAMVDTLVHYFAGMGVNLVAEQIQVTTGGSEALLFAFLLVAGPGDEVIVPEPFYTNYRTFAMQTGIVLRPITTRIEDGFALPPVEAWEAAINRRTRALLICNPSNPTGAVYSKESLEALARLARRRGLFIVADEVYREFVFDGLGASTMLAMAGLDENLVVVDSVSKRYSLCGARIGWLVSRNATLMRGALHLAQGRLSPPTLGQVVSSAAGSLGPEPIAAMREEYQRRRDACFNALAAVPGVLVPRPSGAFYLMARLPVDDADRFCVWMLEEFLEKSGGRTSVALAPGSGFYMTPGLGQSEVRIAFVVGVKALAEAMALLGKGLSLYPGRTPAT